MLCVFWYSCVARVCVFAICLCVNVLLCHMGICLHTHTRAYTVRASASCCCDLISSHKAAALCIVHVFAAWRGSLCGRPCNMHISPPHPCFHASRVVAVLLRWHSAKQRAVCYRAEMGGGMERERERERVMIWPTGTRAASLFPSSSNQRGVR